MSVVYFLGAGASKSAGLPLAGELLNQIAEKVNSGVDIGTKESWERVSSFMDPAEKGSLGRLLSSSNIEVVFTTIDLLIHTEAAEERQHWAKTIKAIREIHTTEEQVSIPDLPNYDAVLSESKRVRRDLLELMDHFFGWKHSQFWKDTTRLTELHELLKYADRDDCVITTNWDTCIEHVLTRDKKWSPCDGYGFPVKLEHQGMTDPIPIPTQLEWLEHIHSIPVLKLHGSYGWRMSRQGSLWLQSDGLLQYLPFTPGSRWNLKDESETALGRITDDVHVLLPSFAKTIDNMHLANIWRLSAQKLRRAHKIVVVGYSLPEADGAIRALFTSTLSLRSVRYPPQVVLVSPDPKAHERFKELLGFEIDYREETLEQYIAGRASNSRTN